MDKNYKDPGCYSEFQENNSLEEKFIFSEDKIVDNSAPIYSKIRVWSINKISKNFTMQEETDNSQQNIINLNYSKIDKVVMEGLKITFFSRDNEKYSFNITMENINFSNTEDLINSKIDTVELSNGTLIFKSKGVIKSVVKLPEVEIVNDLTIGGIDKATSAESALVLNSKLNKNVEEVTKARKGYFGKSFNSLSERLNSEFKNIYVDNVKGMLSTFEGSYAYKVENSIEGRTKDMVIYGQMYQNLSPFGDTDYILTKTNHTGILNLPITIPRDKVITIIFNVKEKVGSVGMSCRGYDQNGVLKEFGSIIRIGVGTNILILRRELTDGIKQIFLELIDAIDDSSVTINQIMILDGDYFKKEIPPFFLGIKCTNQINNNKLIIKNHGKNFFNKSNFERGYIVPYSGVLESSNDKLRSKDFINIEKLTSYCLKSYGDVELLYIYFYDNGKNFVSSNIIINNERLFDTLDNINYCKIVFKREGDYNLTDDELELFTKDLKIQIEEGTVATPYEPYKSCEKTINLSIPLLSIPRQNLREFFYDKLTSDGRIIRKIKKVIIDENSYAGIDNLLINNWTDTHALFLVKVNIVFGEPEYPNLAFADSYCYCDRFMTTSNSLFTAQDEGIACINASPNYIGICILKSRLTTPNLQGFKEWIKENPLTVYYAKHSDSEEKIETGDFNLDTYKDLTYVSNMNHMKSIIEFKSPVNAVKTLVDIKDYNNSINKQIHKINKDLSNTSSNISTLNKKIDEIQNSLKK